MIGIEENGRSIITVSREVHGGVRSSVMRLDREGRVGTYLVDIVLSHLLLGRYLPLYVCLGWLCA